MVELQMRLQEKHQLHESTANELRRVNLENKNLESEKVIRFYLSLHFILYEVEVEYSNF